MKWIDDSEISENVNIDILFERLCKAVEEYPIEKWKTVYVFSYIGNPDPIYVCLWTLYFDKLLSEEDICTCIRDSYILEIKHSFRIIGDYTDADLLDKISDIFPADMHIFPGGGYMSKSYLMPTDEHYRKGHELGELLFKDHDIKTLVKSYLKRRLCWKSADKVYIKEGDIIIREETYKDCKMLLKSGDKSFNLIWTMGDMCYAVPCSLEDGKKLFEEIQEDLQQFIDTNPAKKEKDEFYKKIVLKYNLK